MVYEYVCQTDWIDRERERDRETERQRDTDRGRERERDPLDEKARRFAEMNRGLHNEEMNQQEAQTRFESGDPKRTLESTETSCLFDIDAGDDNSLTAARDVQVR